MRSIHSAAALAAATACVLTFSAPALAGHEAGTARRDPLDATAKVAPATYRSAFSDYRPLSDDKLDWKQANDTAGRIGGWRNYAKEAQSPEPASAAKAPADKASAPASAEPMSKPMPAGHGGHPMN